MFDFDARMCALARLLFPFPGIQAESVGALVAGVESAVPDPHRQWLHINAGLPCNDGSNANSRCDPSKLLEHVATFFFVARHLQPTGAFREGGVFRRERGVRTLCRNDEGAVPRLSSRGYWLWESRFVRARDPRRESPRRESPRRESPGRESSGRESPRRESPRSEVRDRGVSARSQPEVCVTHEVAKQFVQHNTVIYSSCVTHNFKCFRDYVLCLARL